MKVKKSVQKVAKTGKNIPDPAALLHWYDRHRRIMPWRALAGDKIDPYRVWLSEIMLQQTTVATVGPYFEKFIARWPHLRDLAKASIDDVMRMWAGLGYYRRARMLHQCAVKLHNEHRGVFPQEEKDLLALPGFGPYTAAAVRAIAFDQPANVVDGNVERVIARIFAITEAMPAAKKKLRDAAATLVPQKRAGDYAQALMDLGATVCTPRSPKCGLCPWQIPCQAHAKGIEETLPRRLKAQAKPVRRAVAFVLMDKLGRIFLRQRPNSGLLGGMMEVPSSIWITGPILAWEEAIKQAPVKAKWKRLPDKIVHIFTHFTLEVDVATAPAPARMTGGVWVTPEKLSEEALPSVMKKIVLYALKTV